MALPADQPILSQQQLDVQIGGLYLFKGVSSVLDLLLVGLLVQYFLGLELPSKDSHVKGYSDQVYVSMEDYLFEFLLLLLKLAYHVVIQHHWKSLFIKRSCLFF